MGVSRLSAHSAKRIPRFAAIGDASGAVLGSAVWRKFLRKAKKIGEVKTISRRAWPSPIFLQSTMVGMKGHCEGRG